jgi:hypothetical protein
MLRPPPLLHSTQIDIPPTIIPSTNLRKDPIPRDQVQPQPIHLMRVLGIMSEKLKHILHHKFRRLSLSFNGSISELAFLLLQIKDSFFDCVFDRQLIDDNVLGLVQAVHAVDSLFFYELDRRMG